jgi:hypothetical protein
MGLSVKYSEIKMQCSNFSKKRENFEFKKSSWRRALSKMISAKKGGMEVLVTDVSGLVWPCDFCRGQQRHAFRVCAAEAAGDGERQQPATPAAAYAAVRGHGF